jgi:hypothetical protein
MTVDQHSGGNLPANPEDFANTGLEDFAVTDAVIPRISIVHDEGVWKDNLSNQKFSTLRFVILGLVKQRVLFHNIVDDGDVPMCKSPDFKTGFPNPDAPRNKSFPWAAAGFDPADYPENADGFRPLPCDGCQLKEWGTHPNGSTPYCSEQWTLPIYYDSSMDASGDWMPAILTLQKSSIKPIRAYLTSFARSNKPAFVSICEGTLTVNTRGSVDYSTPTFIPVGDSDRSMWMEYSENFVQMKGYLTAPPRGEDSDEGGAPQQAPAANPQAPQEPQPTPTEPPAQPAPAPTPPPQAPTPAPTAQTPPSPTPPSPAADDDLPF